MGYEHSDESYAALETDLDQGPRKRHFRPQHTQRTSNPRPPGIRPAGAALGDQKRVATPAEAIVAGADYLVVGRPLRDAPIPAQAFAALAAEIDGALRTP